MSNPAKRATVYFDSVVHDTLKLKAVKTSTSISDLVNRAVKHYLSEDAADIEAYEGRIDEPVISFSDMVKRLKKDGRL